MQGAFSFAPRKAGAEHELQQYTFHLVVPPAVAVVALLDLVAVAFAVALAHAVLAAVVTGAVVAGDAGIRSHR